MPSSHFCPAKFPFLYCQANSFVQGGQGPPAPLRNAYANFMDSTMNNERLQHGGGGGAASYSLEAGLLDFYNFTRAPFAGIFMGCLSGAEPDVLTAHLPGLMRCFASEYAAAGGPSIDADG